MMDVLHCAYSCILNIQRKPFHAWSSKKKKIEERLANERENYHIECPCVRTNMLHVASLAFTRVIVIGGRGFFVRVSGAH